MNSPVISQPTLRVNSNPFRHGPGNVSACCIGPDLAAFIRSCSRPGELLKSLFRVTIAQALSPVGDGLPDVSGRYVVLEDEIQFIPTFPFEKDFKYRASFDPRPLGAPLAADSLTLEFVIPSVQKAPTHTKVKQIFPSGDLLPENLLRFYVCFSNPMQRGRALEEVSLLDSDGRQVADGLYRPPVELWDRTMRHLTVLLDPGRLKRWVGPNVQLGPPLKIGQQYTFEIGSGMTDLYGRPLLKSFRKHFVAGEAVRQPIRVGDWKILPPATRSREALVVMFMSSLDWALLLRTITIESASGLPIDGQVAVDQCERRWSFTPASPWIAGLYRICIGSGLEDVCGNTITGAFDRPLRNDTNLKTEMNGSSLSFQLT
jgi:hypothetical protein